MALARAPAGLVENSQLRWLCEGSHKRQTWLFCWTEVGAEAVAIVQSPITTCRLHGVDPYTYLVDVLQRIQLHPAKRVQERTPRLWPQHFAARPLRSDVERAIPTIAPPPPG